MNLRTRTRNFLNDTFCPITKLCKKIGISNTYFRNWLNYNMEISSSFEKKIEDYLNEVYAK